MSTIRITPNDYNTGALAGKYALKDMSNTGKFSNIVETLPLRTSLEIDRSSGTITLKEGSLIKEGYNQELDELKSIRKNSKDYIFNNIW